FASGQKHAHSPACWCPCPCFVRSIPATSPLATALVPLLHQEPPPLLVAQIKFLRGSGFRCLLICRLNRPEMMCARPQERHAPRPQFCCLTFCDVGLHE